ncbi:hypothetical protein SSBR45G_46610 [Bradyrhizobium sp. SSBR45G]|uniref:hypothetical protein n=1 Tax=unclassified Bradyrhizobium TaxID=2631580 RepID=UPI0023429B86|nr:MULTISPECIES: hypothetical protein [unclassified Bradyrhizobium]GLH79752.1 hypothetical protein SSBR45G_46610 [Bradyrhizobium sp. SSBR45G]GLH87130.1 hypothetical protein SSBR45R_45900 [Bradyrhizobium sp. SSBR45R]
MQLDFDDVERAKLERQAAEGSAYARLLLSDGWRPLSEYKYDRKYVYTAAVNYYQDTVLIPARGGSCWWTPFDKENPIVGLTVTHWMPLPDGVDAYNPIPHLEEISGKKLPDPLLRRPEPVYGPPAPPTLRLTPGPRDLLIALRDGSRLTERGRDWSSFTLTKPCTAPAKITARPIDPLRRAGFIARNGSLPPRTDRWFQFEWRITEHGHAWLAANITKT